MAKFKVGDRVRFKKSYPTSVAGCETVVVAVTNWGVQVDTPSYGRSTESPDSLEPAFTIREGKFYRTHDGRKVGPITRTGFKELVWESNDCYYDEDGRALYLESTNDLIAEWVDDPASNDNQPVAEQQAGTVFIDASKAGPSQLHVAKGPLVRLNKGYYGYELARFGDYVWVEIGQKAPIVMRADAVTVAA
ncbi:hypothetical protein [Brucella sp. NBRC 113783]|uniref:hypothetical protein n=1 Tax=Brucella sp. NBRC 113783 TaxID=3075478 RepID=UPI0029C0647F|nr:hypothetical protein [Brucella sp. NBRC 113783]MDX4074639.1 hypothetical protein [Brucella sp. NBRC 113783]